MIVRSLLLIVIAFVAFPAHAVRQGSTNAALSGTVTDTTSAVIPGVDVTVENTRTGVVSKTISNEAGIYSFPSLQPGLYRIITELPGFKKLIRNNVNLEVGARANINLQLEVGGTETVVEVSTQMDTDSALGPSSTGGTTHCQ